ncbi:hypothetical protein [Pseudidiomarina sp.]|uniref:hypothetical protein n=1 Tax=Pseudidiomarina sp. TaxID=2081707 RepID=UPI003A981F91
MDHHSFDNSSTVRLGEWMLTLFLTAIPVVNIIALLVWAFSSSTKPSKQNWARAILIWMLIAMVIGFGMGVLGLGGAMMMGSS